MSVQDRIDKIRAAFTELKDQINIVNRQYKPGDSRFENAANRAIDEFKKQIANI